MLWLWPVCKRTNCTCFKSDSREHMLRDCPIEGVNCFKCGEAGHMTAECMKRNMIPACGNCGEKGHFIRPCSKRELFAENVE